MLDVKFLRDNLDAVEARLATRGGTGRIWAPSASLDLRRRELLGEAESLKAETNQVSALIGHTKDKSQVQGEIARMKDVSARIKELDEELRQVEEKLQRLLLTIPNLPACSVPGRRLRRRQPGGPRAGARHAAFGFAAKAHWDLGEELGIHRFRTGQQNHRRPLCPPEGGRRAP